MFVGPLPRSVVNAGRLFQLSPPSVQLVGSPENTLWTFGVTSVANRRNLTEVTVPVTPLTLNVR